MVVARDGLNRRHADFQSRQPLFLTVASYLYKGYIRGTAFVILSRSVSCYTKRELIKSTWSPSPARTSSRRPKPGGQF